ncbi:hypothetical protein ACNNLS_07450 [Aerococcus viridans]
MDKDEFKKVSLTPSEVRLVYQWIVGALADGCTLYDDVKREFKLFKKIVTANYYEEFARTMILAENTKTVREFLQFVS